ncbi:hypothetical protein Y032_0880g2832 [Ancylostoma ceylanicum]|uniref:Uncharacterized protein n=1 Tax=Ancylostoma ceylanicum TaxID=53326 RepID=A0A016W9U5_9BILA|nr:hypothetical protein Y032_0880g2832 [Ancylostoma ceylanicum]
MKPVGIGGGRVDLPVLSSCLSHFLGVRRKDGRSRRLKLEFYYQQKVFAKEESFSVQGSTDRSLVHGAAAT